MLIRLPAVESSTYVSRSQGQEVLPHNLICPLFLQSLIMASGDAVELDIVCFRSIYSCCVFEQSYVYVHIISDPRILFYTEGQVKSSFLKHKQT